MLFSSYIKLMTFILYPLCRGRQVLDGDGGIVLEMGRLPAVAGEQQNLPPLRLCGDNGAMIGSQAYYEYLAGSRADMSLNAYANLEI